MKMKAIFWVAILEFSILESGKAEKSDVNRLGLGKSGRDRLELEKLEISQSAHNRLRSTILPSTDKASSLRKSTDKNSTKLQNSNDQLQSINRIQKSVGIVVMNASRAEISENSNASRVIDNVLTDVVHKSMRDMVQKLSLSLREIFNRFLQVIDQNRLSTFSSGRPKEERTLSDHGLDFDTNERSKSVISDKDFYQTSAEREKIMLEDKNQVENRLISNQDTRDRLITNANRKNRLIDKGQGRDQSDQTPKLALKRQSMGNRMDTENPNSASEHLEHWIQNAMINMMWQGGSLGRAIADDPEEDITVPTLTETTSEVATDAEPQTLPETTTSENSDTTAENPETSTEQVTEELQITTTPTENSSQDGYQSTETQSTTDKTDNATVEVSTVIFDSADMETTTANVEETTAQFIEETTKIFEEITSSYESTISEQTASLDQTTLSVDQDQTTVDLPDETTFVPDQTISSSDQTTLSPYRTTLASDQTSDHSKLFDQADRTEATESTDQTTQSYVINVTTTTLSVGSTKLSTASPKPVLLITGKPAKKPTPDPKSAAFKSYGDDNVSSPILSSPKPQENLENHPSPLLVQTVLVSTVAAVAMLVFTVFGIFLAFYKRKGNTSKGRRRKRWNEHSSLGKSTTAFCEREPNSIPSLVENRRISMIDHSKIITSSPIPPAPPRVKRLSPVRNEGNATQIFTTSGSDSSPFYYDSSRADWSVLSPARDRQVDTYFSSPNVHKASNHQDPRSSGSKCCRHASRNGGKRDDRF